MCLYPRLIINKKYTSTAKNGGKPPVLTDNRIKYVPIGCGNCMECRKQKAREWQARLLEDIKHNINGKFITLTFSDEQIANITKNIRNKQKISGYNLDNEIATYAMRHFLERWRKKYKKSLRHWMVTELGHNGTENIHLHGIIWTNEPLTEVEKIWQYGFMWKGIKKTLKNGNFTYKNYVNEKTIGYITKYVHKTDEIHTTYQSKILTSAGIGSHYTKTYNSQTNRFQKEKTIETYRTTTGHKISIPIYWRNKIYTEEQREILWIQRLEKQERWICGERVDISTKEGEQNYLKLLKWYQERSTQLGYQKQNDEQRWEKRAYEEQQRELQQITRIRKAYAKEKKNKAKQARNNVAPTHS